MSASPTTPRGQDMGLYEPSCPNAPSKFQVDTNPSQGESDSDEEVTNRDHLYRINPFSTAVHSNKNTPHSRRSSAQSSQRVSRSSLRNPTPTSPSPIEGESRTTKIKTCFKKIQKVSGDKLSEKQARTRILSKKKDNELNKRVGERKLKAEKVELENEEGQKTA